MAHTGRPHSVEHSRNKRISSPFSLSLSDMSMMELLRIVSILMTVRLATSQKMLQLSFLGWRIADTPSSAMTAKSTGALTTISQTRNLVLACMSDCVAKLRNPNGKMSCQGLHVKLQKRLLILVSHVPTAPEAMSPTLQSPRKNAPAKSQNGKPF